MGIKRKLIKKSIRDCRLEFHMMKKIMCREQPAQKKCFIASALREKYIKKKVIKKSTPGYRLLLLKSRFQIFYRIFKWLN